MIIRSGVDWATGIDYLEWTGGPQPRDLPAGEEQATISDPGGLLGLYPYSGADVKLVVHMPPEESPTSSGNRERLQQELEDLEERIQNLEPSTQDVTVLEGRAAELRRNVEDHTRAAEEAHAAGNPVDQIELERAAAQEELTELEETIRGARGSAENRAQLVAQRDSAASQLEALGDNEPPPTRSIKTLAELQTLSISTHREKYPVRTLGSVFPRSYTRGPRTLSGSMVFAVFNQHVLKEFLEVARYRSTGVGDFDRHGWPAFLPDQLPPLDISIALANEYGNISYATILGVEFINEGMVLSIEDLYVESTMQWVARDYDPLRQVAARTLSRAGVSEAQTCLTGTSLVMEELRERSRGRRNPFL
jgi:hypothetical protein